MRGIFYSFVACCILTLIGCGSARFQSKTGRVFDRIAVQAVICDEAEATTVAESGGQIIGTIAGKAGSTHAITGAAARVAAKNGGTHLVLTEKGTEHFTYVSPETSEIDCASQPGNVNCRQVTTPATTTTVTHATAQYIVFRLPQEKWEALPVTLQPVAGAP